MSSQHLLLKIFLGPYWNCKFMDSPNTKLQCPTGYSWYKNFIPLSRVSICHLPHKHVEGRRDQVGIVYVSKIILVMVTGVHTCRAFYMWQRAFIAIISLGCPNHSVRFTWKDILSPTTDEKKESLDVEVIHPKSSCISWTGVPQEDLWSTQGMEARSSSIINPSTAWAPCWPTKEGEQVEGDLGTNH